MTRQDLIDRAIATAIVGLDHDHVFFSLQEPQIEILALNAVQDFAVQLAHDPENFYLTQQSNPVSLSNGRGTLPAIVLPESLRNGSVTDGDGNTLSRIEFFDDLLKSHDPKLGYYCLVQNQIFTRQINTGSLLDTTSPLVVIANIIPDLDTLSADLPELLETDLITLLAQRIRGSIG